MLINSLHYSKKLDIRENIPKIQKINGSNYTIRDEFNNNIAGNYKTQIGRPIFKTPEPKSKI